MGKARARFACILAAAAMSVGGCAAFQANPTASSCAKAADQVTAAQLSLSLAQATVAAVAAGSQKSSRTLTELEADVTAAQSVLNVVTTAYAAKCAATPAQVSALRWEGSQRARLALEKRAILASR